MGLTARSARARPVRVVSILDDAIEQDASNIEAYISNAHDVKHLVLDDSKQPVWFYLRPMAHDVMGQIASEAATPTRGLIEVFRQGCSRVDGLRGVSIDGEEFLVNVQRTIVAGSMSRISDATMDYIDSRIAAELGSVIVQRSTLSDEQEKNSSQPTSSMTSTPSGSTVGDALNDPTSETS